MTTGAVKGMAVTHVRVVGVHGYRRAGVMSRARVGTASGSPARVIRVVPSMVWRAGMRKDRDGVVVRRWLGRARRPGGRRAVLSMLVFI